MKTIIYLLIAVIYPGLTYPQFQVNFEITNAPVKGDQYAVYIAGNFNNWDPSLPANSFKVEPNGNGRYTLQLPAGNYEYKFTRGDWNKVECQADGKGLANRTLSLTKDTTVNITIAGWRDDFPSGPEVKKHTASAHVKVVDTAFSMPQLNRQRKIWIYLPEGYGVTKKRYPVIYMHDGQNLFDDATSGFGEWGIDEYLDSVAKKNKKESIIVGIENGAKRMNEYNPYYFKQFGEGEGKRYVDFLVKTLKPYIDKHYYTLPAKQNTFIAGSSMGGLISLYAALKYPGIFGGAGIFSPAFWTANGIDKDVIRFSPKVNSRLFFYAGGKESDKMVPDMKRIEKAIRRLSKSSLKEIIDPGAGHNEAAWKQYFPGFYQWIFNF